MTASSGAVASPAEYVGTFEPGSEAWHAARAHGIGGSEVAPILGLSPFESRFSQWHRKKGLVAPVAETPEMYWGKKLEPVIRDVFRERHPDLDITEVGTWRHRERPWQIANPDGLGDGFVWEAKYALSDLGWGETGTDEVPVYYRAQVLHYCDVFGLDHALISVFIGGTADYREYQVAYDAAEMAGIRDACAEFLRTLEVDERPDVDAHSATYEVLRELHPDIQPYTVDLDPELGEAYLAANAAFKEAETAKKHATSLVADAMGDAQRARLAGEVIASRQCKQGGLPFVQAKPVRRYPKENAA